MAENLSPHSYTAKDVTEYFDSLDRSYGKSEWTDWLRVVALRGCDGPNDEQWNAALDAAAQMFYVDADVIDATYEQRFLRVYAKRIEALKRIPATGIPQEKS